MPRTCPASRTSTGRRSPWDSTLLNPPSVAGWAQGRSWITPALLQERGNAAFDYLFPNVIAFQDPNFLGRGGDGLVGERLRRGYDFSAAIALDDDPRSDAGVRPGEPGAGRAVQYPRLGLPGVGPGHAQADPNPAWRGPDRPDPDRPGLRFGDDHDEAVDALLERFLRMPISTDLRDALVAFLDAELGTTNLRRAETYLEDPLRMVTHLIMSTPEYQID